MYAPGLAQGPPKRAPHIVDAPEIPQSDQEFANWLLAQSRGGKKSNFP